MQLPEVQRDDSSDGRTSFSLRLPACCMSSSAAASPAVTSVVDVVSTANKRDVVVMAVEVDATVVSDEETKTTSAATGHAMFDCLVCDTVG